MAWERIGFTKLSGAGTTITVTFAAREHLHITCNLLSAGGDIDCALTFNDDGGANYGNHFSTANNSSGSENNNQTSIGNVFVQAGGTHAYAVMDILNIAAYEKMVRFHSINQSTAGAGNTPQATEGVGKWENTSDQIVKLVMTSSTNWAVGSEIIVLGTDGKDIAADKSSITDVPIGTRYEETDTRKIYQFGESTINTNSDFENDGNITISATQYASKIGYKIGAGHDLIGKTVNSVQVAAYQQTGETNTSGTCSIIISGTVIGSKNNADLHTRDDADPYTTFETFTGSGTKEISVGDTIFFMNNGSDVAIGCGRWDNPSGGYVVPNNKWSSNGVTESAYDDDATNADDPPVIGNSTSGGKITGMYVTTNAEWKEKGTA